LYWYDDKVGDATGLLSATTSSSGDAAMYTLVTTIRDGDEVEQMFTNSTIKWYSPKESWLEAGDLFVESWLLIINASDIHVTGKLLYCDNEYYAMASDYTTAGSQVFYTYGRGAYGGSWNKW
jgi:hypothetical protein